MKVRKHLAGFAIFSVILSSAILINNLLAAPLHRPSPLGIRFSVPSPSTPSRIQAIGSRAKLVSLDLLNRQSYTALSLRREAGQPRPPKLWVTTVFFSPSDASERVWTSVSEIPRPFANGDTLEYVVTASCDWCRDPAAPKAGYFARVYVAAAHSDRFLPTDVDFDRDITTAIPVVVQAERKNHR